MNIDNNAIHALINRTQSTKSSARADESASFATALAENTQEANRNTTVKPLEKYDFSNMSRQEIWDWSNEKIRNGEITPSEGLAFAAMTMKIRVSDGQSVPLAGDTERFDFMQKVRDGIQGAHTRNDQVTLNLLQSALSIMQKKQG